MLPVTIVGTLPIVRFDRTQWAEHLLAASRERRRARTDHAVMERDASPPAFFTSANGHVLSRAAADPEFKAILDQADGIDADGMPLVLASRALAEEALPERCATTDFYYDMAELAERHELSFYLLGGTSEANRGAVVETLRRYPNLRIAGSHHGYFSPDEEGAVVASIDACAPDILWVGLGVPKEQEFVARNRMRLRNVGVIKSCGGLFDFLSGTRSRAPEIMQRVGCEWLYRLALEPRRLMRRYAVTNVHAAWLLLTSTATPLDFQRPIEPGAGVLAYGDDNLLSL